ncbi:MAG TPA: hypothetical protein VH817_06560 [Thermoleophilaceae bacterium]|jgi:hypothetical protein
MTPASRRFGIVPKLVVCAVAAALISASLVGTAAANQRRTASGSFKFVSDTKTPIGQVGTDQFVYETASISYAGGLTGVVNATDVIVAHSDGSFDGYGTETCQSCKLGGRTGSFSAVFEFHGTQAGITGQEFFTGGSGGLVGLRGGGPFQGGPAGNTYSYMYSFGHHHHHHWH